MNRYLEIFFWTVTVYLIAASIVHMVYTLHKKEKDDNSSLIKAVVYIAGGITLASLLIYKPFGIKNLKVFKPRKHSSVDTGVMITTSLGASSSVGTTV